MLYAGVIMGEAPPLKHPETRRHHFAPQCWLAGFTDTGQKDGRLWVTDLKQRKQWQTSPPNAGHRRDFYRVDVPDLDPLAFEKGFGLIEASVAPVLRSLYDSPREVAVEELRELLPFIALQFVRVPAFRPWILKTADTIHHALLSKALASPTTWAREMKKAGISADEPAAAYERMVEFEKFVFNTGEYSLSVGNEWYLMRGYNAVVNAIVPELFARNWETLVSPSGSFIASDSPVSVDGPAGTVVGFKSAEVVLFPVNRYILLAGTITHIRRPLVTRTLIAQHNTFAMLRADEQLYSHEPDFCWLDEGRKHQNSWEVFSKERIEQAFKSETAQSIAFTARRGDVRWDR